MTPVITRLKERRAELVGAIDARRAATTELATLALTGEVRANTELEMSGETITLYELEIERLDARLAAMRVVVRAPPEARRA